MKCKPYCHCNADQYNGRFFLVLCSPTSVIDIPSQTKTVLSQDGAGPLNGVRGLGFIYSLTEGRCERWEDWSSYQWHSLVTHLSASAPNSRWLSTCLPRPNEGAVCSRLAPLLVCGTRLLRCNNTLLPKLQTLFRSPLSPSLLPLASSPFSSWSCSSWISQGGARTCAVSSGLGKLWPL